MNRVPSLLLLAGVLLLATGNAAHADNFGSGGGVFLANGPHHTVDFQDVTNNVESAVTWALNNEYDPTNLNTEVISGSDYDIRVVDDTYGNVGWAGMYDCVDTATTGGEHPNKWCHGAKLKFNLSGTDLDDLSRRRSISCHEVGHSVGLRHPGDNDGCMTNGSQYPVHLTSHDINHINNNY